jgi:hypothetical protein
MGESFAGTFHVGKAGYSPPGAARAVYNPAKDIYRLPDIDDLVISVEEINTAYASPVGVWFAGNGAAFGVPQLH